jgi:hypothetical protein
MGNITTYLFYEHYEQQAKHLIQINGPFVGMHVNNALPQLYKICDDVRVTATPHYTTYEFAIHVLSNDKGIIIEEPYYQ